MWTSFKRITRAGFVGFWRNAYVSISAIFVMTVTLLVVGGALLLNQLLNQSLDQIRSKVDINVYMVTTAPEDQILKLKSSLEALPDVAGVTYTSRDEALANFRTKYQNDELMLQSIEELGDNPLRASLAIRAKDPSQYENIASFLQEQQTKEDPNNPLIDKVNFLDHKSAIDKLTKIIDAVQRTTYVTMLVLVIATVLITFNTIRLAIYTTREEISIMRLVGAGNMYIRGPFMLQGIMYGLIAGVLALLILYPFALWLGPATQDYFEYNIFQYFVTDFGRLFAIIVGSGVVLGVVSSVLAITRYLRV